MGETIGKAAEDRTYLKKRILVQKTFLRWVLTGNGPVESNQDRNDDAGCKKEPLGGRPSLIGGFATFFAFNVFLVLCWIVAGVLLVREHRRASLSRAAQTIE